MMVDDGMKALSLFILVLALFLNGCEKRECSEAELTDFIGAVQELQNAEDYAQMEKSCVHVRDEFVTFRNKDIGTVSKNRILKLLGKPEEVTCNSIAYSFAEKDCACGISLEFEFDRSDNVTNCIIWNYVE